MASIRFRICYFSMFGRAVLSAAIVFVLCFTVQAAGPRKEPVPSCPRFSLPDEVLDSTFRFAGEAVPLNREDVRRRIRFQVNFLLLDARSVLTGWLRNTNRYAWIFDEILQQEGVPKDFILFSPIVSGLNKHGSGRVGGTGWWSLEKACPPSSGLTMSVDKWHDDRRDLELSTRCFARKLKKIKKELKTSSWIMAAAGYVESPETMEDLEEKWGTDVFWNLPLRNTTEDLIDRWIALAIIYRNPKYYGLRIDKARPLTFDQVSGLLLAKDLPVAEIARLTKTPSRVIMELNPKLRVSAGELPATERGKRISHSIAAPRGKGRVLVQELKKRGYLAPKRK